MFFMQTTPGELENATISGHFGCQGNHMINVTSIVLKKLRFQNALPSTRKRETGVFKFLRFDERFRKAAFWTIEVKRTNQAGFTPVLGSAASVSSVVIPMIWSRVRHLANICLIFGRSKTSRNSTMKSPHGDFDY